MISVQSVNFKPAFRSSNVIDVPFEEVQRNSMIQDTKDEWEGYKNQFDDLSNDKNLPSSFRKIAKAMKVASTGVLTGLGVVWASKKIGNLTKSAIGSKFVKNIVNNAKAIYKKIKKPLSNLKTKVKTHLNNMMTKFKETEFGKKVVEGYKKFKETKLGKAIKYIYNKIKDGLKFVKKSFNDTKKDINFDKINDTTANVMGTGAGVATAYDVAKGKKPEVEGDF